MKKHEIIWIVLVVSAFGFFMTWDLHHPMPALCLQKKQAYFIENCNEKECFTNDRGELFFSETIVNRCRKSLPIGCRDF